MEVQWPSRDTRIADILLLHVQKKCANTAPIQNKKYTLYNAMHTSLINFGLPMHAIPSAAWIYESYGY